MRPFSVIVEHSLENGILVGSLPGWLGAHCSGLPATRMVAVRRVHQMTKPHIFRTLLCVPAGLLGYTFSLCVAIVVSHIMFPFLQEKGVVFHEEVFLHPAKLGWVHAVTMGSWLYATVVVAPPGIRRLVLRLGVGIIVVAIPLFALSALVEESSQGLPLILVAWLWRGVGVGAACAIAVKFHVRHV